MWSATPLVAHCTNASRGLSAIAQFLIMHDIERWRLCVEFWFLRWTGVGSSVEFWTCVNFLVVGTGVEMRTVTSGGNF